MEQKFDLIVEQAGVVAAIKAAESRIAGGGGGRSAAGGTCLNQECVASAIHAFRYTRRRHGMMARNTEFLGERGELRLRQGSAHKEETTEQLCQGVERLPKGNTSDLAVWTGRFEKD
ncbi:MAG: hypothetical protein ACLTLQ_08360 [[Clostridium] scindens]